MFGIKKSKSPDHNTVAPSEMSLKSDFPMMVVQGKEIFGIENITYYRKGAMDTSRFVLSVNDRNVVVAMKIDQSISKFDDVVLSQETESYGYEAFSHFYEHDRARKAVLRKEKYVITQHVDFCRTPGFILPESKRRIWLEAWRCGNKIDWEIIRVVKDTKGKIQQDVVTICEFEDALTRLDGFTRSHAGSNLLTLDPSSHLYCLGSASYRMAALGEGLDFAPDGSLQNLDEPDYEALFKGGHKWRRHDRQGTLRRKLMTAIPCDHDAEILTKMTQIRPMIVRTYDNPDIVTAQYDAREEYLQLSLHNKAMPLTWVILDAGRKGYQEGEVSDAAWGEAFKTDQDMAVAMMLHYGAYLPKGYLSHALQAGGGNVTSLLLDCIENDLDITDAYHLLYEQGAAALCKLAKEKEWVAMNHLLGFMGQPPAETVQKLAKINEKMTEPYLTALVDVYEKPATIARRPERTGTRPIHPN